MTTPEETQDDGADDDFNCSCCYEILLDPTTLACGHTFCRYCLANWWSSSRKAECLQCRRPFHEFPNVNFTLRNTIQRLYPSRIKERRKCQDEIPNYTSVIAEFEEHAESDRQGANARRTGRHWNFCVIMISVTVAVIVLIAIGMRTLLGGSEVLLHSKTITDWTPDDVAYWVGEQGIWAKGTFDVRFKEAGIDGTLLLKMKEEDLQGPPIGMHLGLHRRVFMDALKKISSSKKEQPENFWEFKAANRANSLFFLFGLRQFPRAMILYLYCFDYHDVFLPFLHQTCPDLESINATDEDLKRTTKSPTWDQWRTFFFLTMTVPYYLIGYFAVDYLSVNYWISRTVIFHAVAMGCCEATQISWLITRGGFRSLPGMMLKNFIYVLGCSLLLKILWPFVPFFICDMIFLWMFFVSPFAAVHQLFKRLNGVRQRPLHREAEDAVNNARWQFDFHFRRE